MYVLCTIHTKQQNNKLSMDSTLFVTFYMIFPPKNRNVKRPTIIFLPISLILLYMFVTFCGNMTANTLI
jgi:hypothetical protein